ncbi:MAG: GntR family transcriptional regulator [Rubrivivax sp.]
MNAPLRLERPQLLTGMALERIRTAIVEGQIRLGEQVSEAQLALKLGVSKTPVREALVRLARDGLVQVHPQRGTFVFKLEADQVGQLCRATARWWKPRHCAKRWRATPALAREMARCVSEMRAAEKKRPEGAGARIDMDFHSQFFAFCPNEYLRAGYEEVIRGSWWRCATARRSRTR